MNPAFPTDSELEALARQVDIQLNELQTHAGSVEFRGGAADQGTELPAAPQQQAVIEREMGEPFESFWDKFKRHARRDLCLPEGHLFRQWKKWRDLSSKDTAKVALGVIAGMGIPTASIAPVAVATCVFLLNAITKVGIDAICEGCAEEEAKREAEKEQEQKP